MSVMAQRVQRRRVAGQPGMPGGAVYVGRPSRWGNPFRPDNTIVGDGDGSRPATIAECVALYARALRTGMAPTDIPTVAEVRVDLAGRDLACWCAPTAPCHADVLLRVAAGDDP